MKKIGILSTVAALMAATLLFVTNPALVVNTIPSLIALVPIAILGIGISAILLHSRNEFAPRKPKKKPAPSSTNTAPGPHKFPKLFERKYRTAHHFQDSAVKKNAAAPSKLSKHSAPSL